MAMKCTVCNSPNRNSINQAIQDGETLRNIAKQYGVTFSAVNRHKHKHYMVQVIEIEDMLTEPAQKAIEAEQVIEEAVIEETNNTVVTRLLALQKKVYKVLAAAEKADSWYTQIQAIKEARLILETVGKYSGDAPVETQVVNVFQLADPVLLFLRAQYPDAHAALKKYILATIVGDNGNGGNGDGKQHNERLVNLS